MMYGGFFESPQRRPLADRMERIRVTRELRKLPLEARQAVSDLEARGFFEGWPWWERQRPLGES